MSKRILVVLAAALTVFSFAAAQSLTAAGATFPFPLYSKILSVYGQQTGVTVNYQAIGSGGGQQQLLSRTVNFAASDAPLSDRQLQQFADKNGAPVLHIPMALGAVVLSYNWAPVAKAPAQPLQLDGGTVAGIFLGTITNWNDPALKQLNPNVDFPDLPISVAHRSDGSGTTYTFTDYLSKVSPAWQQQVGTGTAVSWPTGSGGKGNQGVAGLIEQIPGSFGYVELIYALQNDMAYATLENSSGNFVVPSLQSTSAAGDVPVPADGRFDITDTSAAQGYPIATYTYILLYQDMSLTTDSASQAKQVEELVRWMSTDGQKYAESLDYGPLPQRVRDFDARQLAKLTFKGQPLN
ncbi:MAG TPA: phosphate ABC transporter substrate-binding protein PstS [Trueperaceae bacterium]|nr:phosphate ABC transporter substrate-binding protein PstS [Trueperaceae bacterium]